MNYIKLLRRLSTMLEEIGFNLPRFMLYERILPTNHMSEIISKLYAAIIQFLVEAMTFWKSHKIRKFVVALWSPFEIKFGDTIERIRRLQDCVEKDAIATEMAQRHQDSVRFDCQLRELSLVTRHTLQSILEVKEGQTFLLLMNVKQHLFASFDCKNEYQEECTRVYSTFISTEWEDTREKEAQISSWNYFSHSRLTYVQLECLEPAVGAGIVLHDCKYSQDIKRVNMFWGPTMTKESALATLIFGILTKHPEKLLYREASGFYIEKFSCSFPSFNSLWTIFTEIMSVLPELCCTIHVASYDIDATEFITRLMQFAAHSQHGKLDLLIYHTTVNALSKSPGRIELDNEYDVDFDLNACDSFFRIILLEAGYYENLSAAMQTYIWRTAWRSLRYNFMSLTFHQTCHIIRPDVRQHDGRRMLPSFEYESRSHQEASILLKRRIIAFLQLIPFEMSPATQQQLHAALDIPEVMEMVTEIITETKTQTTPASSSHSQLKPPDAEQRAKIWASVQIQFEAIISGLFQEKILHSLNHRLPIDNNLNFEAERKTEICGSAYIQQMDIVGRQVFCQDRWTAEDLAASQTRLEEVLMNAARTGLRLMQKVVYP